LGMCVLARGDRALPKLQTIFLVTSLAIALTVVALTFLLPDVILNATSEDRLVENAQFLFYILAASLQLYISGRLIRGERMRGVFHILLFCLFFFVAMEEISWGQRLFGWRTPSFLWKLNYQREMNIHNIWYGMYSPSNVLLIIFTGVYCFIIPIANHASPRTRELLRRFRLPVLGIDLVSIFFIANLFHAAPMNWAGGIFTVIAISLPITLLLSGRASSFFDRCERPLLQAFSILLVGIFTLAIWLHEPAYDVWVQNVAFESREVLMALGFFAFSIITVRCGLSDVTQQNGPAGF